jgi:hypothetical protein
VTALARAARIAAAAVGLAGCDAPGIATCADSLAGVWTSDDGSLELHVLDRGAAVEAFVISDDTAPFRAASLPTAHGAVIAAPAVLDLRREGAELVGSHARRFQRADRTCLVRTPARLHGCRGDRAVLELATTGAPTDWTLCAPPAAATIATALRRQLLQ